MSVEQSSAPTVTARLARVPNTSARSVGAALAPEQLRAIEALTVAKRGSDSDLEQTQQGHVSALERMRLFNGALAELRPYLASSLGTHDTELAARLEGLQFLVEETRQEIKQQVLRAEPNLPGFIVTSQAEVRGVISRSKFFELLGTRFGVAVFYKRPIQVMMKQVAPR